MIFLATSASRPRADVAYCIHALARRIAKTHNWTVALKSMMVIHRTLREGDPTFREELINYGRNRGHILNLSNFKDDSSPHAWDYSAWVRTYALFLEERLECFRVLKYDVESERPTGHSRTRELDTVELLEHLPALQQLLYRLMGCQPEGAAISNYVIQAALGLVLKESFKLYRAINDGIINLVDKFFEMQRHDAIKALEIYKRAGQQAERLSDFYEVCKGLDLARSFQFPTLEQPPQSFLTTMEDYVKEAPRAGATLMLKNEPEYEDRSPPRAREDSMPSFKEEQEQDASPKAPPPVEETPPPPPPPEPAPVEPVGDLLGLDADLPNASALEDANALALAIIPEGQTANGNGPTFDINDPAGWELALVTNPTDSATAAANHSKLAGGFDKLTLDSLYDDALQKRGPNGAVPNSYNMGMNTAAPNPFQAPGMPQQHMDPFMASGQYQPSSNVQMAMMQQQQAMLMQQQQQQQMMGMAPGAVNPFGSPYAGGAGGQYPYGAAAAPQPIPGQLALPAPPPAYHNPFGNPGLL
ncbi:hypothetical protein M758_11G163000 [Ceratodon purpureus]|nr:hypothetical protein KC19_11G167000 [Ceratodon purpureus]KAG0602148.1 hypothetical protein M758_11G162900 [Ceratodon purpureus]KAG0602150.1 hypothetical protein M758_11G163000 [Ceratodon purpureus]